MFSPSIESIYEIFEGKFKSFEYKNTESFGKYDVENFVAISKI